MTYAIAEDTGLEEDTETPVNTYAVGALIGLVMVFAGAAWARARRGKK